MHLTNFPSSGAASVNPACFQQDLVGDLFCGSGQFTTREAISEEAFCDSANQKIEKARVRQVQYSELAMLAAKKMRYTRKKQQTGHTVCQHLLSMLNEEVSDAGRYFERQPASRPTSYADQPEAEHTPKSRRDSNDQQIALAF